MQEPAATAREREDARLRELMAGYQAGSPAAFDELYARLAPIVRHVLGRQPIAAGTLDDLVQETFLQIHRARHTYDDAYPVLPWVVAIARHTWLMQRRAASRRPAPSEDVASLPLAARASAETYAEAADLRRALGALSANRRRSLVWHHVWGYSFREIAERFGIRVDAAKLRSSRGMAELRRRLAGPIASRKEPDGSGR